MRHTLPMLTVVLALGACSSTPDCAEQQPYQRAVPGKPVELLEGMSPLPPGAEMSIPEASPNAPKPPGECVDAPPTLRTDGDAG